MKLFKLFVLDFGYDDYDSFLVKAEDETQARELLNKDNFSNMRYIGRHGTCEEIKLSGEPQILLSSFNAG